MRILVRFAIELTNVMRASGVKLNRVGAGAQPTEQPRRVIALVWLSFFVMGMPGFAQTIVYVNQSATGAQTGQSWKDAFTDLQSALDLFYSLPECDAVGACEIWIAEGTYYPSRPTDPAVPRTATFSLRGSVAIYGGFGGWEKRRNERNPDTHETILHGDLEQNDDPRIGILSNCCEERPDEGGCDDPDCEARVMSDLPSRTGHCLTSWDNFCVISASLACCQVCRPSYCDNTFHVMTATDPGSTPTLDGVTVTGGEARSWIDEAHPSRPNGGAGMIATEASLVISDCRFIDNHAWAAGGGISAEYSNLVIRDSLFLRNSGSVGGVVLGRGSLVLSTSRFEANGRDGLSVSPFDAVHVESCEFVENEGKGALLGSGGTFIVKNSLFAGNTFKGLDVRNNYGTVVDCKFLANSWGLDATETILDVDNTLFIGNTYSGIVSASGGESALYGCVFAFNLGPSTANGGPLTANNCVFWNNIAPSGVGAGITNGPVRPTIFHSLIQNYLQYYPANGNLDVDPMFADPDGRDNIIGTEDDDYRLLPTSPLINRGDPDPDSAPITDADGHARILRGRIDIGANEFGIGDYDWSRFVDIHDAAAWPDCMTGPLDGPYTDGCEAFDFVADETFVIDLRDLAGFQRAMTDGSPITFGPAIPEKK